ncbi:MAG: TldD/PmbA family protein, partial [Verrucomicrobiae bacterium]|nr:TldD/PmbA family protein [Verrucomicrobiae bacterium]
MHRRDWLKGTSAAGLALLTQRWQLTAAEADVISAAFPKLADAALGKATALGASFADFHVMQTDSESLFVREEMVQGVDAGSSLGASVRVLVGGAWGFAASDDLSVENVIRLTESA